MSSSTIESVAALARRAKDASFILAQASEALRNEALGAMAQGLRTKTALILEANRQDMELAREKGTSDSLLDRLALDEGRIESMASALEDLAALPDPLGRELEHRTMYNGVELSRVSVPLGLVAMVYEARPNVTADAAGICIKTGNACILRGGSLAFNSNLTIAEVLQEALSSVGLPSALISPLSTSDRSATDALLKLHGVVDLLIPRGGAGLIRHCVEHSTVPVIETGVGNCHVYVHDPADYFMALDIIINAKCQRPGVCNAVESLLIDSSIAEDFLPLLLPRLHEHGVAIHGDEIACDAGRSLEIPVIAATEEDWGREYLGMEISVKCVSGLDEAIEHINRYGTKHSECIVTEDPAAGEAFLRQIDAAAVYVNASTRFTDGGEFGLGAEIGISTQKLHARGPFALEALTSYKYLLRGNGQVR